MHFPDLATFATFARFKVDVFLFPLNFLLFTFSSSRISRPF